MVTPTLSIKFNVTVLLPDIEELSTLTMFPETEVALITLVFEDIEVITSGELPKLATNEME